MECHFDCWECDGPNYNDCTHCWLGEPELGVCTNYLTDMIEDIESMSEDEIDAWIDEVDFDELNDLLGDTDFEDFLEILDYEEDQYLDEIDWEEVDDFFDMVEDKDLDDLDDYEEEWDDFWKDADDEGKKSDHFKDFDDKASEYLEGGDKDDKYSDKNDMYGDKEDMYGDKDDRFGVKDDKEAGRGEDDDDDAGSSGDGRACGKTCRISIAAGCGFGAIVIIAAVCYCYHSKKNQRASSHNAIPTSSYGASFDQGALSFNVSSDVMKPGIALDQMSEGQPVASDHPWSPQAPVVYPNVGQYAGQPGVQMQGIPVAQFLGQPGAAGIIPPQVSPGNKQVD